MSKRVCIFCGARTGNSPEIIIETKKLVAQLANQDYDLVYGGGSSGLMGLIADEFLAMGRKVIGVRPSILLAEEITHQGVEMIVTKDMFERKQKMVELSDSFIALPGGVGTLDEIIEVFTLNKVKHIDKPCAVFNINGFYDKLNELLDVFVEYEYLDQVALNELIVEDNGINLVQKIENNII
mgnify:CR=1 FL=1